MEAVQRREKAERKLESLKELYFKRVEEERTHKHQLEDALRKTNPQTPKPASRSASQDAESRPGLQLYSKAGEVNLSAEAAQSIALDCEINFVPIEFLSQVDDSSASLRRIANESYLKALQQVARRQGLQPPVDRSSPPAPSKLSGKSAASLAAAGSSFETKVIDDIDRIMREYEARGPQAKK